jgi:hypothetical protein
MRCVHDRPRPAPTIRSQRPQASDRDCGKPLGLGQAVRGLPHATTRRMIGAWRPTNGESRITGSSNRAAVDNGMYKIFRTSAIAALSCFASNAVAADLQVQYQALMTRYFLGIHSAIPLFSNGSIRSADIIRPPDETVFLQGKSCFPNVIFDPKNIPTPSADSKVNLSLGLGGEIPPYIAEIEARIGGTYKSWSSFDFDPFAQDSQKELALFSNLSQECKTKIENQISNTDQFLS